MENYYEILKTKSPEERANDLKLMSQAGVPADSLEKWTKMLEVSDSLETISPSTTFKELRYADVSKRLEELKPKYDAMTKEYEKDMKELSYINEQLTKMQKDWNKEESLMPATDIFKTTFNTYSKNDALYPVMQQMNELRKKQGMLKQKYIMPTNEYGDTKTQQYNKVKSLYNNLSSHKSELATELGIE